MALVGAVVLAAAAAGTAWVAFTRPAATPGPAPSSSAPANLGPGACPPEMAFVEGATFAMGSEPGADVRKNETPLHTERVAAFCLDTTEVTVAAYGTCASCDPAPTTVEGDEITSSGQQFWSKFCNAGHSDRGDHPINCVSWQQARDYCRDRGKRLPSEQEWELAARGSDRRFYPWGNDPPSGRLVNACGSECSHQLTTMLGAIGKEGWPAMHADDDGAPATAAVGSYPAGASPAGVLDLAGNVWEWTASPYCPYGHADCGDSRRVLRGGGWDVPDPGALRASRRHPGVPTGRGHNIGFRCAWSSGD